VQRKILWETVAERCFRGLSRTNAIEVTEGLTGNIGKQNHVSTARSVASGLLPRMGCLSGCTNVGPAQIRLVALSLMNSLLSVKANCFDQCKVKGSKTCCCDGVHGIDERNTVWRCYHS
jgi:hypothetical protein